MTNTVAEGVAFVIDHPTRQNVDGAKYRIGYGWSWSQLCVALVYWAVGATHTYGTANLARAASHIVSTSRNVPDGAIVWFSMGADGHVGFWKGGVFYSATRFASNLGSALGTMTLEQYEKASGGHYLGYSWDFGGQSFATLEISEVSETPISEPTQQGDGMYCMDDTPQNILALYDGEHWQEFKYAPAAGPGLAQYQIDFAFGMSHSIPHVPFDQIGWTNRSTKLPACKQPFFIDTGTAIVPITPAAAAAATPTTVKLAAADEALLQAIAAKTYPTTGTVTLH